ncbi:hypothetical protein JHK87_046073 [Glycine soja]|nr:hypothetical protein JHK87_046073 [Glycine soja]
MDKNQTKLEYFDEMWRLQCTATLLSHLKEDDDGRHVLILDRTIFYPQGGGQPPDTGFLLIHGFDNNKFLVSHGCSYYYITVKVFHYGFFENLGGKFEPTLEKGKEVSLFVDEFRRKLNSRLHSAGHLLKICLPRIGLGNLEPGKAYHFPDGFPLIYYRMMKLLSFAVGVFLIMFPSINLVLFLLFCTTVCFIVRIGDNPRINSHVADISDIKQIKV